MFTDRDAGTRFRGIVRDVEMGAVNSLAFVLPHEWVWPIPLYELALMTAARARSMDRKPKITFITSEGRPLKAFGQAAGDAVVRLLEKAGITLHTGVVARVPAPGVLRFDGMRVEAERIVTLPNITGPAIRGIPAGARWFVPIDEWCVVSCTDGRVFAAGTPRISRSNRAELVPSKLTLPPWHRAHRWARRPTSRCASSDSGNVADRRASAIRGRARDRRSRVAVRDLRAAAMAARGQDRRRRARTVPSQTRARHNSAPVNADAPSAASPAASAWTRLLQRTGAHPAPRRRSSRQAGGAAVEPRPSPHVSFRHHEASLLAHAFNGSRSSGAPVSSKRHRRRVGRSLLAPPISAPDGHPARTRCPRPVVHMQRACVHNR